MTEQTLALLAEILDIDASDADRRFEDLGVDSLAIVEWLCAIEEKNGVELADLDIYAMEACTTPRELVDIVASVLHQPSADSPAEGA